MSITVRIPTPLRQYTGGKGRIAVSAETVGEAFDGLVEKYPELRQHLFDDDGRLRNFVNAYLNEEDVRELEGTETPVSEGDTVVIVPSIAGGAGRGAERGAL